MEEKMLAYILDFIKTKGSSPYLYLACAILIIVAMNEKITSCYKNMIKPLSVLMMTPIKAVVMLIARKEVDPVIVATGFSDCVETVQNDIKHIIDYAVDDHQITYHGVILPVRSALYRDVTVIQLKSILKAITRLVDLDVPMARFKSSIVAIIDEERIKTRDEMKASGVPEIIIKKVTSDISPFIEQFKDVLLGFMASMPQLTVSNMKMHVIYQTNLFTAMMVPTNSKMFHTLNGQLDGIHYKGMILEPHTAALDAAEEE